MKKKNRGFTLIELIVAIAVLSIMAVVLLQTFVISRRLDLNARKDEVAQDAGKKTMEALKGYSFEELDELAGGTGQSASEGTVTIAGTEYHYEKANDLGDGSDESTGGSTGEGYRLTCLYRINPSDAQAAYLIEAEADYSRYSEAETGGTGTEIGDVNSVNNYQMPEIADVSDFRNVVLEPELFTKEDELRTGELLLKVNPEPEEDENGETAEAAEPKYDESDVKRFLKVSVRESGTGDDKKMTVTVKAAYTVKETEINGTGDFKDSDHTTVLTLLSEKKRITQDEAGKKDGKKDGEREADGKVSNSIYLFLPKTADLKFEQIFADSELTDELDFYIIVPKGAGNSYTKEMLPKSGGEEGGLTVRTNLDDDFVPVQEAKKRLYHLTVTVYEADYSTLQPKKGEKILTFSSTKQE